jgi:methylmalonyl-CoA mutase N-terminal domain/subunit
MEKAIMAVIDTVENAGGMFAAAESGLVQRMIGESALAWQDHIETGDQKIVGVNCYRVPEEKDSHAVPPTVRPAKDKMRAHVEQLRCFKAERSQAAVEQALTALARAANSADDNVFARVVEATASGVTHGEVIACLRQELGFGQPLIVD